MQPRSLEITIEIRIKGVNRDLKYLVNSKSEKNRKKFKTFHGLLKDEHIPSITVKGVVI